MGRNVTYWKDEVAIYNHSISSLEEAKSLLDETNASIKDLEQTIITCSTIGAEALREKDDTRSPVDIVKSAMFNEYGILPTYEELIIQRRLLESIIENWDKLEVQTEWGHYGEFKLYSASEE